jgi:hypothetical protein
MLDDLRRLPLPGGVDLESVFSAGNVARLECSCAEAPLRRWLGQLCTFDSLPSGGTYDDGAALSHVPLSASQIRNLEWYGSRTQSN